jgi:hypothetical protein
MNQVFVMRLSYASQRRGNFNVVALVIRISSLVLEVKQLEPSRDLVLHARADIVGLRPTAPNQTGRSGQFRGPHT